MMLNEEKKDSSFFTYTSMYSPSQSTYVIIGSIKKYSLDFKGFIL